MGNLIEKDTLHEIACGSNVTYVLDSSVTIQTTEYKVMQNQEVNCLAKCMRMKYNGQDALYYLTGGFKSFLTLFLSASPDAAANLVLALLRSLVELKSIGFLSCINLLSPLQKIYVDANTNRVMFIYFPIDLHFYPDELTFESEFRSSLVHRIDELPGSSDKLSRVRQALIDSTLSLEQIVGTNAATPVSAPAHSPVTRQQNSYFGAAAPAQGPTMTITAVNAPERVQFVISKNEFRIGKSPDMDGVISFNNYVGRTHCVISRSSAGFFVMDLNSKNGTFVNGSRLAPQQPCRLKAGDILRLANSDFRVALS